MQNSVRGSRLRMRAVVLSLLAAGVTACDNGTGPEGSVTTEQLVSVASGLEAVANQQIFIDLFGSSVIPNVTSAESARRVTMQSREMLLAAARATGASGDVTVQAAEAFPADIKGKTYVPTNDGGWVWDPALPSPGTQVVRFIVRNDLGQTRGWLDLTDQNIAGSAMRYRAELFTVANVKVMDYVNEYMEQYLNGEVNAYSYAAGGVITDGQTNINFDYGISEAGLTSAVPSGTESYTVEVPRLDVTFDLTGQGNGDSWTNDYTMRVRDTELLWRVAADGTVRLYRGNEHIASGTRSQFGETFWRTPNGQLLSTAMQAYVNAADRAGEALFAPVTATILVDWMAVQLQQQ